MTAPTLARKTFWLSLKYWFGWLIPESQETPCVASKVNVQASCIFHYADKLVSSGIAYCSVKLTAMKYIQHLVMPVLHFIHYLFQCMPTDAHFVECCPQIFITANTIKQRQIHGCKHQVQSRVIMVMLQHHKLAWQLASELHNRMLFCINHNQGRNYIMDKYEQGD